MKLIGGKFRRVERRRSDRIRLPAFVAASVFLLLFQGFPAFGFVPKVERTMKAIAKVNRASGRTKAIAMDLTMRVGDREPIASGKLITHPSGLARLELRGYGGRIDRYLLSGDELLAAKDGEPLDRPQPMLQPIFLLQPDTLETLRAALRTFGVESEWIGIAPCGERDCFVIGDPRLVARPQRATAGIPHVSARAVLDDPLGEGGVGRAVDEGEFSAGSDTALGLGEEDPLSGPTLAGPGEDSGEGLIPRLWVDMQQLEVRRIDRANGVFTVFGPMVHFEKLEVPAWFEIHEPGAQTIRFDVERAVQVNAPPQAFSRKWLFAPVEPPAGSVSPGPEPASVDPAADREGIQTPGPRGAPSRP